MIFHYIQWTEKTVQVCMTNIQYHFGYFRKIDYYLVEYRT